jgi:hypothetical protein
MDLRPFLSEKLCVLGYECLGPVHIPVRDRPDDLDDVPNREVDLDDRARLGDVGTDRIPKG